MQRFKKSVLLVGLLSVAVLALVLTIKFPLGVEAQQGCTLATLTGSYIWRYDGSTLDGDQRVPYAYAGQESYDGNGTMSGVFSGSYNGEIDRGVKYTGSYTVNADCSGTLDTLDETGTAANFDIYINAATGDFVFVAIDDGELNQGLNTKVQ